MIPLNITLDWHMISNSLINKACFINCRCLLPHQRYGFSISTGYKHYTFILSALRELNSFAVWIHRTLNRDALLFRVCEAFFLLIIMSILFADLSIWGIVFSWGRIRAEIGRQVMQKRYDSMCLINMVDAYWSGYPFRSNGNKAACPVSDCCILNDLRWWTVVPYCAIAYRWNAVGYPLFWSHLYWGNFSCNRHI